MSESIDIIFEKTPEMCCVSDEIYHKSNSNGYTEMLLGAFFPSNYGLPTCIHLLI